MLTVAPLASAAVLDEALVDATDGVAFSSDFYDRNGNGPALNAPISQGDIPGKSLTEIRQMGALVYTTPFRHADGHGDGPGINRDNPTAPDIGNTGRPTLQGNGTFLRVNGLDSQTCQECHGVINNSVVPVILGIAGQGQISASPMFMTKNIDVDDSEGNSLSNLGIAFFDGRLINPPKNLGMGGVELAGQAITRRLQKIARNVAARAQSQNRRIRQNLVAQGISFGAIIANSDGDLDFSAVRGVDADLVIKPFGRKGEFPTVRAFDEGAMVFHIGMQNVDTFGFGDPDGDGVPNELTTGQMSALHIFLTTTERPFQKALNSQSRRGRTIFNRIGCADCHVPNINTFTRNLEYRVPGEADPFYSVDLSGGLTQFATNRRGGITVPTFSDYKRHNMGSRLAETAHFLSTPNCDRASGAAITNCNFITMKLWGAADTAPYLHDGRALTLFEAIALHGGEAQRVRDRYLALSKGAQDALLSYLGTLKNPVNPNQDVLNQVQLDP